MVAIETSGTVNQEGQLILNQPLQLRNQKVKVLVLVSDLTDDDAWLAAQSTNPAFDFLHDKAEDIYSLADGKPLTNET